MTQGKRSTAWNTGRGDENYIHRRGRRGHRRSIDPIASVLCRSPHTPAGRPAGETVRPLTQTCAHMVTCDRVAPTRADEGRTPPSGCNRFRQLPRHLLPPLLLSESGVEKGFDRVFVCRLSSECQSFHLFISSSSHRASASFPSHASPPPLASCTEKFGKLRWDVRRRLLFLSIRLLSQNVAPLSRTGSTISRRYGDAFVLALLPIHISFSAKKERTCASTFPLFFAPSLLLTHSRHPATRSCLFDPDRVTRPTTFSVEVGGKLSARCYYYHRTVCTRAPLPTS